MNELSQQDSRSYFLLPQAPEEASYYTYGTPGRGAGQYSHPSLMSFVFQLEVAWGGIDNRKIGIGNISLANGAPFPPHRSHKSGLEVDIRPIRKDGKKLPVRYTQSEYDRSATAKLIDLIWRMGTVKLIAFNDISIPRVKSIIGHDDHLHVEVIA